MVIDINSTAMACYDDDRWIGSEVPESEFLQRLENSFLSSWGVAVEAGLLPFGGLDEGCAPW